MNAWTGSESSPPSHVLSNYEAPFALVFRGDLVLVGNEELRPLFLLLDLPAEFLPALVASNPCRIWALEPNQRDIAGAVQMEAGHGAQVISEGLAREDGSNALLQRLECFLCSLMRGQTASVVMFTPRHMAESVSLLTNIVNIWSSVGVAESRYGWDNCFLHLQCECDHS